MWYAKMYFSEKKEFFQYDSAGIQGGAFDLSRASLFREPALFFRAGLRCADTGSSNDC